MTSYSQLFAPNTNPASELSLELVVSEQTAINVVLKKKFAPISLHISRFTNSDVLSTNVTFKTASDYMVVVPGVAKSF